MAPRGSLIWITFDPQVGFSGLRKWRRHLERATEEALA